MCDCNMYFMDFFNVTVFNCTVLVNLKKSNGKVLTQGNRNYNPREPFVLERCGLNSVDVGEVHFVLITIKTLFVVYIHHLSPINLLILLVGCISKQLAPKLQLIYGRKLNWTSLGLDITIMIFVMIFHYYHKNHVMSSPNLCDDWNVILIQSYVLLL